MRRVIVSPRRYFDSVFLMQAGRRLAARPGMRAATLVMATPANKRLLADLGYDASAAELRDARPDDLALALDGDPASLDTIAAAPERCLSGEEAPGAPAATAPRSIRAAVAAHPGASLAVISVPGRHAAREARAALEQNLDVFLFSSNVPLDDERSLKQLARSKRRLFMGPDCGTAYIAGAGLGFANAVRRGPVGVIASSGTGLQEFASLLHRAGSGLSHGIGTGSRDLSDAIGGLTTFAALDALLADPATRCIAIVGKPPGDATLRRLLARCERSAKPVVLCLLGAQMPAGLPTPITWVRLLDQAVSEVLKRIGEPAAPKDLAAAGLGQRARQTLAHRAPAQRHLRGLFAGGTFCCQAQVILRDAGVTVHSNAPIAGMHALGESGRSVDHTLIDMGAEAYVNERPHPMIDPTLRRQRLLEEAADPTVAVILLDFVLGSNASHDPVGDLLPAIRDAVAASRTRGGQLCIVASVCGTAGDPQGFAAQRQALGDAGVQVFDSNAQAASFAAEVIGLVNVQEQRR